MTIMSKKNKYIYGGRIGGTEWQWSSDVMIAGHEPAKGFHFVSGTVLNEYFGGRAGMALEDLLPSLQTTTKAGYFSDFIAAEARGH